MLERFSCFWNELKKIIMQLNFIAFKGSKIKVHVTFLYTYVIVCNTRTFVTHFWYGVTPTQGMDSDKSVVKGVYWKVDSHAAVQEMSLFYGTRRFAWPCLEDPPSAPRPASGDRRPQPLYAIRLISILKSPLVCSKSLNMVSSLSIFR
jgi:hypothetical protein